MDSEKMIALHADLTHERANVVIPMRYLEMVEWDYIAAIVLRESVAFTAWSHNRKDREGWWYRTESEWQEKLHLSLKQVNRCIAHINKLAGTKIIEKETRKVRLDDGTMMNNTATHYRVNSDAFVDFYDRHIGISGNCPNGSSGNIPNGTSGSGDNGSSLTYRTELTTELIEQDAASSDADLSGLEGLSSALKKTKKSANPQPPNPPAPAKDDRRVWGMVDSYFDARGLEGHKMPNSQRHAAYNVFKELGPEYGATAVYGCASYLASQQWYQEPGRLTAKAVSNAIHEWDKKGRPTAEAPRGKKNTAYAFAASLQDASRAMKEQGL